MTVEIMQTFYQRMMPLFTPQAEKILETMQPEKFHNLAFRYTFSVEAMIKISHIIEDAAIYTVRAADLHTSFQYSSRIIPQLPRYRQVAANARGLWLYYENDSKDAALHAFLRLPHVTTIETAGTPLVNYWFVVAYGGGIHMTLLAHEVPSLGGDARYYEGFYTFQADAAYQIVAILHQIYPQAVPLPLPPDLEPCR